VLEWCLEEMPPRLKSLKSREERPAPGLNPDAVGVKQEDVTRGDDAAADETAKAVKVGEVDSLTGSDAAEVVVVLEELIPLWRAGRGGVPPWGM
jgi:hypothetical protein